MDLQPNDPLRQPLSSKKWGSGLLIIAGLLGLAALYFAVISAFNSRSTTPDPTATATATKTPFVFTPRQPTATPQPGTDVPATQDPLSTPLQSTANLALVRFIHGEVFQSVDGNSIPLRLKDGLSSPSSLTANADSGVFIELTDARNSASFLYLFSASALNLEFDAAFSPQLIDGRLYLQSGLEEAAIHFPTPSQHIAVAILEGRTELGDPSRMLVETLGDDLWIWCLHGSCYLQNEHGDRTPLPVMTKSLYHAATGTIESPLPITPEELWAWQVACAYRCLTGFATQPVPTATITPTVLYTATSTPRLISTFDPTSTRPPTATPLPTATIDPYPPPPTNTPRPFPYP